MTAVIDFELIRARAEACDTFDADTFVRFYEVLSPNVALALLDKIERMKLELNEIDACLDEQGVPVRNAIANYTRVGRIMVFKFRQSSETIP